MPKEVKRRSYDTTRRDAQSDATRQRIIGAARSLIIERGYRATSIAAIAEVADVNIDTVYALVGRKPLLLREVIEQAISGTDHPVSATERDYVKAIIAEPDPAEKLAIYARATRAIHARMAPLYLALRDAAATDRDAQREWNTISQRRAANIRDLARDLRRANGLRAGLSITEAADILWVTNSAELYVLLTIERVWTPRHYQRWLTDTWQRLLLP